MSKVWQLRTKIKINNIVGAGFTFNVMSKWSSGHPTDAEIKEALEKEVGKNAGNFSAWSSSKYEILS